jgi:DNA adenine methylase
MISVPSLETYFGGKGASGTYQTIINHIPPHDIYIEPFLGGGSVMKHKRPAPYLNWGMDIDQQIIDKWNLAVDIPSFKFSTGDALIMLESFFKKENSDLINTDLKGKNIFIYLDPPYLMESRKSSKKQYRYELSKGAHIGLCILLLKLSNTNSQRDFKINMAISCYDHTIYSNMLSEWNRITFDSQTRHGKAVETLYMNYDMPRELHDYSFLGENFRERERIRNKIKRHVSGLKRLPELERMAILNSFRNEFTGLF